MRRLQRTLLVFWCVAAVLPLRAADEWRAGVGRRKITPEKLIWMTGFGSRTHPAEGTLQDLWVKAVALQDSQGNKAVLLTADLCAVPRDLTDAVAAAIGGHQLIPRRSVLINVSHTHCAPSVHGAIEGLRIFTEQETADLKDYRRTLEAKMIEAALAAVQSLKPATLAWARDTADFGVNRRENIEKEVPVLRAAGKLRGPVDHDVPVCTVRGEKGELVAVIVSYACHPTALNLYQWTGDYAGFAQEEIERRHPGALALFVQGCGADIGTAPRNEIALAKKYGHALAGAVDRVLAKSMQPVRGRFRSAWADMDLPFSKKPTREELQVAKSDKNATTQVWAHHFLQRLNEGKEIPMSHAYPVQVWRLGELAWVALGGEVVVDYSLRLKKMTGANVWVFGYSNDVMAYIPSERVLREDARWVEDPRNPPPGPRTGFSGYEGYRSMRPHAKPSPWKAGLEEKIVAQVQTLLHETRER